MRETVGWLGFVLAVATLAFIVFYKPAGAQSRAVTPYEYHQCK